MKPYQFLVMFLFPFFASCRQPAPEQPRISIFADHIVTAAQQEGISFAEAAARFREMGYAGVDVSTNIDPAMLQTLDSLGFAHACAIIWIDLVAGPGEAEEEGALDFMRRTGWDKLLLVPGFLPEDAGDEVRDAAIARVAAFAEKAAAEGFPVLVEDFDNPRSLCYDTAALDRLFAASAKLGHAFDTGGGERQAVDERRSCAVFSCRSEVKLICLNDLVTVVTQRVCDRIKRLVFQLSRSQQHARRRFCVLPDLV